MPYENWQFSDSALISFNNSDHTLFTMVFISGGSYVCVHGMSGKANRVGVQCNPVRIQLYYIWTYISNVSVIT